MPDALRLPRADDEPDDHPRAPTPHTHSVRGYADRDLGPVRRCRVPGCRLDLDAAGHCTGAASALGEVEAIAMRVASERKQSGYLLRRNPPWPPPEWRAVEPQPAALEVGMRIAGVPSMGIGEVMAVDDETQEAAVLWPGDAKPGRYGAQWARFATVVEQRPERREGDEA